MPVGGPAFPQHPVIERAVTPKHLHQRLRPLGRRAEEEPIRAAHPAPPSPSSPTDVPTGCRGSAAPYPHPPRRPIPPRTTTTTAWASGSAGAETPPAAPPTGTR